MIKGGTMRSKGFIAVTLAIILTLVGSLVLGCRPVETAESYMAIVPKVFHSGNTESLSLTLFRGERLIKGEVEVALLKEGKEILKVKESI